MRRIPLLASALLIIAAVAGCGQSAQQASETSSDSLLAANPIETPAGDITPQETYQEEPAPDPTPTPTKRPAAKPPAPRPAPAPVETGTLVPAGTPIALTVDAQISSQTALPGSEWTGTVKSPVIVGSRAPIPAGSVVRGVVSGVKGAEKGSRAFLVLTVTSITVNGTNYPVSATTDSIIAGSTRARNLGAIAGGATAGALIGKAVGGSGKGAVIGGLIGAAATTGAVAASKGYQVVLKEGTELTFTVNQDARFPT
jgi:hypothetical protein